MKVNRASLDAAPVPSAGLQSSCGSRCDADKVTQDVFARVLADVGRAGYASATPIAPDAPIEQSIGSSWDQWFNQFSATRYQFMAGAGNPSVRAGKTAEDLQSDYRQILIDAYQRGGYANPQGYLRSLSTDQLAAVQQVHHLADPIQASTLSEEAALNLLLPPDAQVDANHDGLTAVGAAYTGRFPDSNTPAEVTEAWEKTTAGMTESDRMLFVGQMILTQFTANLHVDANGQYIGSAEPGDADWVNPRASADYSYLDQANRWLEYLDRFRYQMTPEQYDRDQRFWSSFRDNLQQVG